MKYFLIIIFYLISVAGFSQQTVINDPNAVLRNVEPFTEIRVSGGINVYLSQANDYSLAVSANDSSLIDDIKTEVKDNVLNISADVKMRKHFHNINFRVYISFKTLESIVAAGASSFFVQGVIHSNDMMIRLSGASTIEGAINCSTLNLQLSGASIANVSGENENVKIDASGASDIKNYELKTQNCIAKLSGASDVRITILNSLTVSASGASTFYYDGNPDKKIIQNSGASAVFQKGN